MAAGTLPTLPPLGTLNACDAAAFVAHLAPFFETASPLLDALATRRPFASDASLFDAARAIAATLPLAQQRAILDAHPAIGAPRAALSAFSSREQGYDGADALDAAQGADVSEQLAALNALYRERHGFTFVVFVNGRSQEALLPILRERLERPTVDELATALGELVAIAQHRAQRKPTA